VILQQFVMVIAQLQVEKICIAGASRSFETQA